MSMQGTSENVLTAFTFSLEIDSVTQANFVSVDGLSVTVDVVDSWTSDAAGNRVFEQKVAGTVTYGEITIVANLSTNTYLRDWRKEVIEGKFDTYRRNGSIVLYNTSLEEQTRWNFVSGWPSNYQIGDLSAGNTSANSETVTIVHEGLVRA